MTLSAFLLWTSILVHGQEVLIPAPDSPPIEWKAYLHAHAEFISPTAALEKQRPSRTNRERLIRLFAEAQSVYLSNDLEGAKERYKLVANETWSDDWADQDREILLVAHLRLAQLAEKAEDRQAWLIAGTAVGDAHIDSRLFPPPLWAEWQILWNNLPERTFNISGLGSDWTQLLINGRPCKRNPCRVRSAEGLRLRLTWISDHWVPVTRTLMAEHIETAVIERRPWLKGRCGEMEWSRDSEVFEYRVGFFSLACAKRAVAGLNEKNLHPLPVASTPQPWRAPATKSDRPLYKSVWLWLGVGTIAAIVVANSQKPKESREPTTTYGY